MAAPIKQEPCQVIDVDFDSIRLHEGQVGDWTVTISDSDSQVRVLTSEVVDTLRERLSLSR